MMELIGFISFVVMNLGLSFLMGVYLSSVRLLGTATSKGEKVFTVVCFILLITSWSLCFSNSPFSYTGG